MNLPVAFMPQGITSGDPQRGGNIDDGSTPSASVQALIPSTAAQTIRMPTDSLRTRYGWCDGLRAAAGSREPDIQATRPPMIGVVIRAKSMSRQAKICRDRRDQPARRYTDPPPRTIIPSH